MDQDQKTLQTVRTGVERLRQGIPFLFNNVRFSAHVEERLLDVGSFTSRQNVTLETAAADLKRAETTYLYLKTEFPEFGTMVSDRTPRFSVIEDMGNCHVELAYLDNKDIFLR